MKKNYALKNIKYGFIAFLFYVNFVQSQVTISSLTELKTYITQDNVDAVMSPGVYNITSSLTGTGNLFPDPIMIEFTGDNSTYDFTGVTFVFDTEILNDWGNVEVVELRVYGNNNVLRNLTMIDSGTDAPRKRARAIHLDGLNNRIEGFHITTRGSYPYGYGDLFGKGSGSVIGHRKHSGILVRGDGNHIKDCTLIHRSYGHGIFIQGGKNVLIEDVYIEGDGLRTTDDVLTEEGTGSAADNVDFMTVWGYKVPQGYMFSKQEDGIRTYASAGLYSNDKTGDDTVSYTENVTIKNCTVKRMRSGYSFAFGSGDFLIENSTSLECESGFSVLSGGVIKNCFADAKYGMIYGNAYNSHGSITADITVLNSEGGYGPHHLAYIGGSNSDITLKTEDGVVVADRAIQMGGEKNDMRMLNGVNASQTRHSSTNNSLTNYSGYPVVLDQGNTTINGNTYSWTATGNTIKSCSANNITDNGSNNTIIEIDCDSENLALTGVATQSSTGYEGVASRAIDGDTNGKWSGNSVTHTNTESNPWWQVELAKESNVNTINIYGRTDSCCKARLNDFTVSVIDADSQVTFSEQYTNYPDPLVSVNVGGVKGKWVKIVLNNNAEALSLAEVEVLGESTLSVNTIDANSNLRVYPNPVVNELKISSTSTEMDLKNVDVSIYNMLGQKILKQKNKDAKIMLMDVSSFKAGTYLLMLTNKNNTYVKKIIKQ